MNPSPSLGPVEVYVHSGPAEWWQIVAALGPFAVLIAASIAALVGWRTLKQKSEADDRAEWWRRVQWGLDAVHSSNKKKVAIGYKVLAVLGTSKLANKEDLDVLEAAWERPLAPLEPPSSLQGEGNYLITVSGQAVDGSTEAGDNGSDHPDDAGGGRP